MDIFKVPGSGQQNFEVKGFASVVFEDSLIFSNSRGEENAVCKWSKVAFSRQKIVSEVDGDTRVSTDLWKP